MGEGDQEHERAVVWWWADARVALQILEVVALFKHHETLAVMASALAVIGNLIFDSDKN
jgi:hypothetical protein